MTRCSSSNPCYSRLLLGQPRFDQLDDRRVVGLDARAKAAYHVPLAVDHELLEIPGHLAGTLWFGIQASQMLVEGSSGIAVDLDLGKHIKSDIVLVRAEGADLLGGTRLLAIELVAGKSGDSQALLGVLVV